MDVPLSLGDIYHLVKYLTEKDLFELYEESFNKAKKNFPEIDRKEAFFSQKNEEIRKKLENIDKYVDTKEFKNGLFTIYYEEVKKEGITEEMLHQFLDSLFETLEIKIRSHPKVREMFMFEYVKDIGTLTRRIYQSTQCPPHDLIQTPQGMCKMNILTKGFLGKFRLILGENYEVLGDINHGKILEFVEKMEGDPEYHAKNPGLASEVCKILVESLDHISKEARIAFSIILSKVTEMGEFLEYCELPSRYDEFNFQVYVTQCGIMLHQKDVSSAREYLGKAKECVGRDEVLVGILEGRILAEEYNFDEAIEGFERIIGHADFYEKKIILFYLGLACYQRSFLEKSLKCWKELEELEENRSKRSVIIGNIGIIYCDKGELDEALKYYEEALKIDREIGNKLGEAIELGNIGIIYSEKGELGEAQKYYEEALKIAREIGYKQGEASALGNIGLAYRDKGELDEALKYHEEALKIDREIGYKQGEANDLGNIGMVYNGKGKMDEALECHKEALKIDREIGYKQGEAIQLLNIGIVYCDKGKLDEALEYSEEALKIDREIGYKQGEVDALGNMGIVCRKKEGPDEALEYYEEALKIAREIGYKQGEAIQLSNIGLALELMGRKNDALEFLNDAQGIFDKIGAKTQADTITNYICQICSED